jgi:gamma-glutamyltranspeptidase/glutathione hydrolase
VDKDGNMASLTHSVYGNTFGPGFVVDGIQANSGNAFPGNVAGPGRRTVSPFPPTMVARDGKPWMTIGSPGLASEAIAITLINRLGYGKDLASSVDAPRFSGSQLGVDSVVENRVAPGLLDELRSVYGVAAKPTVPYMWHFGSIQAIERQPDGSLLGVADARRAGLVAGY